LPLIFTAAEFEVRNPLLLGLGFLRLGINGTSEGS